MKKIIYILVVIISGDLYAYRPIEYSLEEIETVYSSISNTSIGTGRVLFATERSIGSVLLNPGVLDIYSLSKFEMNISFIDKSIYAYQTSVQINSIVGIFSLGTVFLDKSTEFLRFNVPIFYMVSYSYPLTQRMAFGVSSFVTPWSYLINIGYTYDFNVLVKVNKLFTVRNLIYSGLLKNIKIPIEEGIQVEDEETQFVQNIKFSVFPNNKYIQFYPFIQMSFSYDLMLKKFHLGGELKLLNFIYLRGGGYGNDLMKVSSFTFGGGIDIYSDYIKFSLDYSHDRYKDSRNHSVAFQVSFNRFGKPSRDISASLSNNLLSARNKDGLYDTIQIRFQGVADLRIKSWKVLIIDIYDNIVKEINSDYDKYKTNKRSIPEVVIWNGRDNFNSYVKEGEYNIKVLYEVPSGEKYYIQLPTIIVDDSPPFMKVLCKNSLIKLQQDGSSENLVLQVFNYKKTKTDSWNLVISDSGKQVIRKINLNGEDIGSTIEWDLTDQTGQKISPGKYSILLVGKDLAGNKSPIYKFHLKLMDLNYLAELIPEKEYFSSLTSDNLKFYVNVSILKKLIKYEFSIKNRLFKKEYTIQGKAKDLPKKILWNGKNNHYQYLKDGIYFAELILFYKKKIIKSDPVEITIDTQIPEVNIKSFPKIISPDNDGKNDFLTIQFLNASEDIDKWSLSIINKEGGVFRSFSGKNKLPDKLIWDGTDNNGKLAPSLSDYYSKLYVCDKSNNCNTIKGSNIKVDFLILEAGNQVRINSFDIIFGKGRYNVYPGLYSKLNIIGRLLEGRLSNYKIILEGHTDSQGNEKMNYILGLRRAKSVRRYLLKHFAISKDRINIYSKGKLRPTSSSSSRRVSAHNRRVEFLFYK